MPKKRVKFWVKCSIYIILIIVLTFLGVDNLLFALNNKELRKIEYVEQNNIDYKVYLIDNNYFETPFLKPGITYISSLIDYIDINFNYNANYDKALCGNYTYQVFATLIANKANQNNEKYWSKTYKLTDETSIDFTNQFVVQINQNVRIDYSKYNNLLTSFKKEFGLAVDGILKVELKVKSNATNLDLPKAKINTVLAIVIPLTQSSVDIAIDTKNQNNSKVFKDEVVLKDKKYQNYKVVSGISFLLVLLAIYGIIFNVVEESKRKSNYEKSLKRILYTYDSIIVNVSSLKDLSSYNIIRVKTFEELIDAHSEVRMPINFIEIKKGSKSIFVLIHDDIAWVYELVSD